MATILGLDLGTNSIGWTLIDDEHEQIKNMGVRIFSEGVNIDQFGKEESKNAQRRNARLIRRQNNRYKLRRKRLLNLFAELNWKFDKDTFYTTYELYALRKKALTEKISLQELARIFFHINQRRGFQSNRKADVKKENSKEDETGVVKEGIKKLEVAIAESKCRTIGEYFFSLIERNKDSHNPDEPIERIRSRYTSRQLYQQEFDLIWQKQREYYPELLTGASNEKYISVNGKKVKTSYHRIRNECIFYQRPLKSQKDLVARCRFEPGKRCCPKSSLAFQEFRLWQKLADIRVTTADRYFDSLTLSEKQSLAEILSTQQSMGFKELKKELGFNNRAEINLGQDEDRLIGNRTNAKFSRLFGEEFWKQKSEEGKFKLWHTYLFAPSDEWLYEYGISHFGMSEEQATQYIDLSLEPDYSSISQFAIQKILPYLKVGLDYTKACDAAGYHHSYDEEKDRKDRPLNNSLSPLKNNELRNPVVQQAVSEGIRLVNQIVKHHGTPDKIRVEFTRELKKPKEKREEMRNKNNDRAKQRQEYCDFLNEKKIFDRTIEPYSTEVLKYELWLELGYERDDLDGFVKSSKFLKREGNEKFRLWLECDRISAYSGKPISLTQLFSPEIEIDHIIPYSESMDDSYINKILAEHSVNKQKKDRLPYHYFNQDLSEDQWREFVSRLKTFKNMSKEKVRRMMMTEVPQDFMHSQLTNSAYIAKELRKKLKTVCAEVEITSGAVTSKLRRLWGLNSILNKKEDIKSRDDHRHHALDALVISCTTPYFINKINRDSQFDENGRLHIGDFPKPWSLFKEEAEEKTNAILISYRKNKRLLVSKLNKLKNGKVQKTKAVRDVLHEETNFGRIHLAHQTNKIQSGVECDVIRKKLSDLKKPEHLEKVVDPKVREVLKERLMKFDGNFQKAFSNLNANPVYMYSRKGVNVPINKVRMVDDTDKNRIQIRPGQELFTSSGNSFMLCIYQDKETGKRAYETIRFFDAVVRKQKGNHLYPLQKDGKDLLFTLQTDDTFLIYNEHPDEIDFTSNEIFDRLYSVIKFDVNGIIVLGKHNYANIKADKDKAPIVLRKNFNSLKAVKVRVDILGNLSPVYDQAHTLLRQPSVPEQER